MFISNIITSHTPVDFNAPPAGSNAFVFKIEKACTTSAGVYAKEKRLVRTLWSGKKYEAGTYTEQWDGKDDEGNPAPGGNYEVMVLSNNMKYDWEGVIGNTSDKFTGSTVYHHHSVIYNMCIAGNTAYYASAYSERLPSQNKFSLLAPQQRIAVVSGKNGQMSTLVTSDGTTVYWAGYELNKNWFVFATNVADDSFPDFANQKAMTAKFGRTYNNAINITQGPQGAITGLAVQKRGQFLLISYNKLNEIHLVNKKTGALVHKQQVQAPGLLSVDADDNVWGIYNGQIQKFSISNDGSFSSQHVAITGITDLRAMAVSPDSRYILIADGGNNQQLKAYSTGSGKLIWTFGKEGGYAGSATVANDKFYFSNKRGDVTNTFICFAPNGSFWVGDPGNNRVQHYDASRNFIERIMYMPAFYSCTVDANNPVRVFADYLEFEVDYAKSLAPDNQSWKLVANWGYNIPKEMDNKYGRMKCVTTLKNGRTYTFLFDASVKKWQLAELGADDKIRLTGIIIPLVAQLYPDGSIRKITYPQTGKPMTFSTQSLLSFDGAGNPQWGLEQVVAVSPPNTNEEPLVKGNLTISRTGEITASGVLVAFDGSHPPKGNGGWHLGGIKLHDNNQWQWRTAKSTTRDYKGPFPPDGSFDVGNGVKNAGSVAMVVDNYIVWGYYGEFWKGSETNKWNQVYHNGLFMNQFGIVGTERDNEATAMFAGNAISAALIKAKNGKVYLYHNDENTHGGIHRWLLGGFDTVQEQVIKLSLSRNARGMSGTYFRNNDLNNLNTVAVVRDSSVHFPSLPLGSIRWAGFIEPDISGEHTFHIHTNGKVRLWIDNNLLIDRWSNDAYNEFGAVYNVSKENTNAIKIELSDASNISFLWSNRIYSKEIITNKNLIPSGNEYSHNRFNLLDGILNTNINAIENNLYGWQNLATKKDNPSKNTYDQDKLFPLKSSLQSSRIRERTRSIALSHPVNSWEINSLFVFKNKYSTGNIRFDVFDKKERIIASLLFPTNPENDLLSNDTTSLLENGYQIKQVQFSGDIPIIIRAQEDKMTTVIGSVLPLINEFTNTEADWKNPYKIRIRWLTDQETDEKEMIIKKLSLSINV